MTGKQRIALATKFEKPWHKSKKFVAFLIMEVLLSALAIVALFTQPQLGWPLAAFMLGVVVTMGCIALVFNGYQAKLDMYVRGMALTGQAPRTLFEQVFGKADDEDDDEPQDDGEA
jgi:hypothetical protein